MWFAGRCGTGAISDGVGAEKCRPPMSTRRMRRIVFGFLFLRHALPGGAARCGFADRDRRHVGAHDGHRRGEGTARGRPKRRTSRSSRRPNGTPPELRLGRGAAPEERRLSYDGEQDVIAASGRSESGHREHSQTEKEEGLTTATGAHEVGPWWYAVGLGRRRAAMPRCGAMPAGRTPPGRCRPAPRACRGADARL